MLVLGKENKLYRDAKTAVIYVEGIPKGTSVAEDSYINLIVKGAGEFRYTAASGAQKVVVKAIWKQKRDL